MARKRRVVYKENPFLQEYVNTSNFRRVITSAVDDEGNLVTSMIGRDPLTVKDQGLMKVTTKIIDPTPFIKIKALAINAMYRLSESGIKVLTILYDTMQGRNGTNRLGVVMAWDLLTEDQQKMVGSRSSFYRGLSDLVEGRFIAASVVQNYYFLNPKLLYNGDSVVVATEYIKEGTETAARFRQLRNRIQEGGELSAIESSINQSMISAGYASDDDSDYDFGHSSNDDIDSEFNPEDALPEEDFFEPISNFSSQSDVQQNANSTDVISSDKAV